MAKIVKRCDIAGFFGGEVLAPNLPDRLPKRLSLIGFFGGVVGADIPINQPE